MSSPVFFRMRKRVGISGQDVNGYPGHILGANLEFSDKDFIINTYSGARRGT
jgi:hypothetical protein